MIIHASSSFTKNMTIFGGLILILGGYISSTSTNIFIQLVGVLNIIFGLLVATLGVLALFHIIPKITIDEKGIKDSIKLKNAIPWDNIEKLGLEYVNNQNKLLLVLRKELDSSEFTWLNRCVSSKKSTLPKNQILMDISQCEVNYKALLNRVNEKHIYFKN